MKERGKVYLVGAGPGDPGLITVKGRELLRKADVVVYDQLANERLLEFSTGEKIYVGKQAGRHSMPQAEINRLLARKALDGKTVVRLKGGDPFVFGRGGEEVLYLRTKNVDFEIVPGITSAVAVPAYAGIPVTHRGKASSVTFVTGHEDPTKERSDLDWDALASSGGTLVFLMGVKNLKTICTRLVGAGMKRSCPAAVIENGTTSAQRVVSGTLSTLPARAQAGGVKPPAVLVVGDVVSLRSEMRWYEILPLFGRRILVTRTRAQAGRLSILLGERGAEVIEIPTISIEPPHSWAELDAELARIEEYDWLILTSANGVDSLLDRMEKLGVAPSRLRSIRICTIGPATAERLAGAGIRVDAMPEKYVAEEVVRLFESMDVTDRRILLPRAAATRDVLPRRLREMGADVTEVVAYRTVRPRGVRPSLMRLLSKRTLDCVTFTSSSTCSNFVALVGKDNQKLLKAVKLFSIGPITTNTAHELGLRIAATASDYTIDGLVECMVDYYSK
ncbi:MAG: uroporphyrinogen-III C-methyltransferase [Candidatus Eiseniibacteriota bacterium]|nr:MAG: uroporphyrinogen-III C-methyltransferase [Candidatus Eisenbacteria bacterium]